MRRAVRSEGRTRAMGILMKRTSRTAACAIGLAGIALMAGGCSFFGGSSKSTVSASDAKNGGTATTVRSGKLTRSSDTITLEPFQQVNLAVSGENAELLVENRGQGQLAFRVPQNEASLSPSDAYTMSVDGSFILEFYNASRVPTTVRYTGSGVTPVTISMLE